MCDWTTTTVPPMLAAPGGPPGGSPAGIATALRDAPAAVREIVG